MENIAWFDTLLNKYDTLLNKYELIQNISNSPIGLIVGALIVFIIGLLFALLASFIIKGLLRKLKVNEHINNSLSISPNDNKFDLTVIIGKLVFWFVIIMATSASLSILQIDMLSSALSNMTNSVLISLPTLFATLMIALVGWVIASIIRDLVGKNLQKLNIDKQFNKLEKIGDNDGGNFSSAIKPISRVLADIVYWFVLLLVLTTVLGRLGLDGLFNPLTNMLNTSIGYLPNIFVAIIVFVIGWIAGKVVSGIVSNLVATTNLQSFTRQAGISNENEQSLPNLLGSLAFLMVIIPTTIISLEKLQIQVIAEPATNMLNKIMMSLPNIFIAVAIMTITYFVMKLVSNLIKGILENTSLNSLPQKMGIQNVDTLLLSDVIAGLILFFAMLFAGIVASDTLGFSQISDMITMFISFGANILLGTLIMVVGFWLANLVANLVKNTEQGSSLLANLLRVLIMGLVLAMGLKSMGIADSIVNLAFGLTLGSVAVAFALAVGVGAQESVARLLRNLMDKYEEDKK